MVPETWEKHPVGKLCISIVPGRNKPKSFDGDIPWVTTPEIQGRYIPSSVHKNFISQKSITECGAKVIPKGSVVIAAVGELGLTAIALEPLVLNQQLHAFVCPDTLNNEYLAYFLSSQKHYMDSVASKTTIPYMNKTNCESIPILLPPLVEQAKIAKILSTWDQAIDTTEKLIENSKAQKKSLMQLLLTGKKRFPGFDGEWKVYRLSEIADVIVSNVDKRLHGDEESVLLCNYTDVYYNDYITADLDFMEATATKREIGRFTLIKNDVVITKDSETPDDIAVPALVKGELSGVVCGYHLAIIRPNSKLAYGGFINSLFALPRIRRYFFTLANGATRFGLSIGAIKDAKFIIPSIEEQQRIAKLILVQNDEIINLTSQQKSLVEQKKALMQQLLTGKRRVKIDNTDAA